MSKLNTLDKIKLYLPAILTLTGFIAFMGIGMWGLIIGKLGFTDFFAQYGPIVGGMIGWWGRGFVNDSKSTDDSN